MREDVRLLVQQVGDLSMRVEQLERENELLKKQLNGSDYATIAQLNEAVADLNRAIKAGDSATVEHADVQIQKLANASNASIDSLAKALNQQHNRGGLVAQPVQKFDDNYPSHGISYTVQRGDSISLIARKTGAKTRDIINANKIADPTKLQPGDVLFIPGGK